MQCSRKYRIYSFTEYELLTKSLSLENLSCRSRSWSCLDRDWVDIGHHQAETNGNWFQKLPSMYRTPIESKNQLYRANEGSLETDGPTLATHWNEPLSRLRKIDQHPLPTSHTHSCFFHKNNSKIMPVKRCVYNIKITNHYSMHYRHVVSHTMNGHIVFCL